MKGGASKLYARTVFFVSDTERATRFYTEQLGFSVDWNSNDGVCQVSLFGFELILNQAWKETRTRAGHGRLFIGLDDDQGEPFREHLAAKGIRPRRVEWGRPTLVVSDPDGNELFFWLPHDDFSGIDCARGSDENLARRIDAVSRTSVGVQPAIALEGRALAAREREVLGLVQSEWGPQNTEQSVQYASNGEAHLWVRDRSGERVMFLSVTNLAEWHRDGTLSREKLLEWIRGPGAEGA